MAGKPAGKRGRALSYLPAYWRFNLNQALEYRASFVSQVLAMFANDILWVLFWAVYFQRFPVVRGWTLADVLTMWAVVAFSFGLAAVFAGNAVQLPRLIYTGQLDYFLALPKPVLPHVLVSRMSTMAWGDLLFGPLVFYLLVPWTWTQGLLFLLAGLLAALVFGGFGVIAGSLAFFLGNSEQLSGSVHMAILHFATYPMGIFDKWIRVILHTLVPAAFMGSVPVEVIRRFSWGSLGLLALGAAVITGAAVWVFTAGLRRYESGNLVQMRS